MEPLKRQQKRGEVASLCRELLLKVVGWQIGEGAIVIEQPKGAKDAQPVGLGYQEILGEVLKQFPDRKTSYNCLRWYNSKMREEGIFSPSVRRKGK